MNTDTKEMVELLKAGGRLWWDVNEKRFVRASTIYIPFGCPDWGERGGSRNHLCTFCALPNAVAGFRQTFFGGKFVSPKDLVSLFRETLRATAKSEGGSIHTLMLFNAGSFLAMPIEVQVEIMRETARHPDIKHVVIESRAELVTEAAVGRLVELLERPSMRMTIRIGVETQDDKLRLRVLRKGHTRSQLRNAIHVMRASGVFAGGYALLNPAPGLSPEWAIHEALATLDWILGRKVGDLGMDEAYFCSTNVGPGTPLETEWRGGRFTPATLWMVFATLQSAIEKHGHRVHLLPFKDEPPLLAVPSNHVERGVPETLDGARECDIAFHAMLERYRTTMDADVLVPPACNCKPQWSTNQFL
jgi:radical SAM enzyme (TIGR01210 family)